MYPFVALLSWLCFRGPYKGYLFCDIKTTNAGNFLVHEAAFSVSKFTKLLRERLSSIEIGERDAQAYSDHSIKRGAVQLYWSLGYKDE